MAAPKARLKASAEGPPAPRPPSAPPSCAQPPSAQAQPLPPGPRRLQWPRGWGLVLALGNLALLLIYPLAWSAPLLRAALLPIFGLTEISVLSGLRSLWQSDPALAILVGLLALGAPLAKTLGLALVQCGLAGGGLLRLLHLLGRLAMAEVFLLALYLVLAKGVGHATVEVGWGLWLFTFCVLAALGLSLGQEALERRRHA